MGKSAELATAIPRPYLKISWELRDSKMMLVSIDPSPARLPYFVEDLDSALGIKFDIARAKILKPIADAGGLAPRVPGGNFEKTGEVNYANI